MKSNLAVPRPATATIDRRSLLRGLSGAALLACVPTGSLGQSASSTFAIRYSPLARVGALGFIAQDLAVARDDPADPNRDLQK